MKRFSLLIIALFSLSFTLFAEEARQSPAEKKNSQTVAENEKVQSNDPKRNTLEEELKINVEQLNQELKQAEENFIIYKSLAITGYSLAGLGLGLIIVDALAATPREDPTDAKKFGDLTWSAIPFALIGALFSVTFRVLEVAENDKKIVIESNYYDARSELELIQSQQSGKKKLLEEG